MGTVFDIQKFSIHDGPGIRTTVFLQGCNNSCLWCHNPESLSVKPELQTYFDKCIGCGSCFEICPNGCHCISVDNAANKSERIFKRDLCTGCGLCCSNCYSGSLLLCGEKRTADEVVKVCLEDKPYYDESGGGVTISGGEPFMQYKFLKEILVELKEKGIHTCIQTALNVPWEHVLEVAPYVDLFMCDFKIFDEKKHIKYIGNDGKLIRENLKKLPQLKEFGCKYVVRTPVIGGVNDSVEEIQSIVDFLVQYVKPEYYQLMPYHNLGLSKLEHLGVLEDEYGERKDFYKPDKDLMTLLESIADKCRF